MYNTAVTYPVYIAVVALLALFAGCMRNGGEIARVTGTIEGTTIGIGSRVGGRIAEVLAKEGDTVAAGDIIVRLECTEQEAAVAAAKAKLAQAEATLQRLETGARPEELEQARAAAEAAEAAYLMALNGARSEEIEAARAIADSARAQRDTARADFDRIQKLFEGRAVSQQMFDQALHRLEAAEAQFTAAREQLDLLASGTRNEQIQMAKADRDRAAAAFDLLKNGTRKEDIDAARAARDAAQAELARAEVLLGEMTVKSPRNAVIESFDLHAGDIIAPGPMLRLTDPDDLKLIVYVSALALGQLHLGDTITFTTDAHGDETFSGSITYIAPSGEFTPRNLQTEEERVQQVFGVRISFDSHGGKLRPGMAATALLPASAVAPS